VVRDSTGLSGTSPNVSFTFDRLDSPAPSGGDTP
jgi:hypothetical protein